MHARQAALTGAVLLLMLPPVPPAHAEKDAAIQAQEGDINHWIEYYRKNQPPQQAVVPATRGAVVEVKREETKGESEDVKVESEKPEAQP